MHWNRSTTEIQEDLNHALAFGIESGTQPHFVVGYSRTVLDGLLSAMCIRRLAGKRAVPLGATFSAGGSGLLWLHLLMQNRGYTDAASDAVSDTIVYAGADVATEMATVATLSSRPHPSIGVDSKARWSGLSTEQRLYIAPTAEPLTITPLDALPFIMQPITGQASSAPKRAAALGTAPATGAEQMILRSAVLLFSCALVAAALLL